LITPSSPDIAVDPIVRMLKALFHTNFASPPKADPPSLNWTCVSKPAGFPVALNDVQEVAWPPDLFLYCKVPPLSLKP